MENYENNNVTPETEEVVEETPVAEENPYGQGFANYQTEYVSKKEFLKNNEGLKKTVKTASIVGYVLVGINVISLIFNFLAIFDIAILLGCTLGVHLKKSKGCAIAILVYGIISCIIGLVSAGIPTGWGWIIIAIVYLVAFNKAEKEYKAIYGA